MKEKELFNSLLDTVLETGKYRLCFLTITFYNNYKNYNIPDEYWYSDSFINERNIVSGIEVEFNNVLNRISREILGSHYQKHSKLSDRFIVFPYLDRMKRLKWLLEPGFLPLHYHCIVFVPSNHIEKFKQTILKFNELTNNKRTKDIIKIIGNVNSLHGIEINQFIKYNVNELIYYSNKNVEYLPSLSNTIYPKCLDNEIVFERLLNNIKLESETMSELTSPDENMLINQSPTDFKRKMLKYAKQHHKYHRIIKNEEIAIV